MSPISVDEFLAIHNFQKRKKTSGATFVNIGTIGPLSEQISIGGNYKSQQISLAEYRLNLVQSEQFWQDANARGYEINKQTMAKINEAVISKDVLSLTMRLGGPPAVVGVVGGIAISNVLVHVQYEVNKILIGWMFD